MEQSSAIEDVAIPAQSLKDVILAKYKLPLLALTQLTGSVLYERVINGLLG